MKKNIIKIKLTFDEMLTLEDALWYKKTKLKKWQRFGLFEKDVEKFFEKQLKNIDSITNKLENYKENPL